MKSPKEASIWLEARSGRRCCDAALALKAWEGARIQTASRQPRVLQSEGSEKSISFPEDPASFLEQKKQKALQALKALRTLRSLRAFLEQKRIKTRNQAGSCGNETYFSDRRRARSMSRLVSTIILAATRNADVQSSRGSSQRHNFRPSCGGRCTDVCIH